MVFPLYRRAHRETDRRLVDISRECYCLSSKYYHISEELQIDRQWFQTHRQSVAATTSKPRNVPKPFTLLLTTPIRAISDQEDDSPSVISSSTTHSDVHSSSLSLGSISYFRPPHSQSE